MGISIEEARTRAAIANPNMTADEVRREADRIVGVLDGIAAEDALRGSLAAQVAEEQAQAATDAQRRAEAFTDAQSIVRESHPGWSKDSVNMEAERLAAENAAALAAQDLREALADGFDASYALRGRS